MVNLNKASEDEKAPGDSSDSNSRLGDGGSELSVDAMRHQILALKSEVAKYRSMQADYGRISDEMIRSEMGANGDSKLTLQPMPQVERSVLLSLRGTIETKNNDFEHANKQPASVSTKKFPSILQRAVRKLPPTRASNLRTEDILAGVSSKGGSSSLKAFLDTVSSAVSVSEFQQDGLDRKAFKYFSLLSISNNRDFSSEDKDFSQGGPRYLDPFRCEEVDVMDVYPKPMVGNDDAPMFDFKDLGSFCFPYGARARLLPRGATKRAKEMGLLGKSLDKYQVLMFTDASGETRCGVAITCMEELESPTLVSHLSRLRKRRRAAVVISRWWKRVERRPQQTRQHPLPEKAVSFRGWGWAESSLSDSSTGSFRGMSSSWISSSFSDFGIVQRGYSSSSSFEEEKMTYERKVPFVRQRSDSIGKSMNKHPEVSRILEKFLRTSPLPMYDSENKSGIWVSAKLKKCRTTGSMYIVVKLAPLHWQDELVCDLEVKLENERWRLVEMAKNIKLKSPTRSRPLEISKILFKECRELLNEGGNSDGDRIVSRCQSSGASQIISEEYEPSERIVSLATESFKFMQDSEKSGEVCLVEKCYLLMGGHPKEQSLLLASLQQLVDFERKQNVSEDENQADLNLSEEKCESSTNETMVERRHNILNFIREHSLLTPNQSKMTYPSSELEHVSKQQERFELSLPIPGVTPISLPLPLPQVTSDWALGMMLLRIGPASLMKALNILLRERSLLIIGRSSGEVSACAMALRKLLQPYKWPNTFLPLLPQSLLEFLLSPVPFLVGISVESQADLSAVLSDERTLDALSCGMGLLNLSSGTFQASSDFGDEDDLPSLLFPTLKNSLNALQSRLAELAKEPNSSFRNVESLDPLSASESLHSFVQSGLTQRESLTLCTVSKEISNYMRRMGGDLHEQKTAWRRYGRFQDDGEFRYDPNLYLEPLRAHLRFMEEMAQTQMFCYSVNSYKNEEIKAEKKRLTAGQRIAQWLGCQIEESRNNGCPRRKSGFSLLGL